MTTGYFHRVTAKTPTRLWVNNPTAEEAATGIRAGARSCTTNPTYAARMLSKMPKGERALLLSSVGAAEADADRGVDALQCHFVAGILPLFAPLRSAQRPLDGLVSIQGDPHHDTDADHLLTEAERYAGLGPNVILKIPATQAGLQAIETLLRQGRPVLATEMMSVAQTRALCATYRRAAAATPRCGTLIATHITGIFDECLAERAQKQAPGLDPLLLAQAGTLVARKVRAVLDQEGLPIALMGGGARSNRHFTDMVGGDMHITINPDMIERLVAEDAPVVDRFHQAASEQAIATLRSSLPDFRCAWDEDGLRLDEFERFPPIVHFLDLFKKGWNAVRDQLALPRQARAVS